MAWKLSDIAKAVGGELLHAPTSEIEITQVNTDSREASAGAIFVPLVAERNGHDFINSAIEAGAVASFWSDQIKDAPKDLPIIVVEDTEETLQTFAKWHLKNVQPKVVGITGSNGKTTTKDMTEAVLKTKYQTHKTPGNENNQLGVPRTILSMPEETEVLILEMGMDRPGEIERLTTIAQPDVAVITMIGESHIQAFGSRKKIAEEKLSILKGLKADGLFIHPEDEPLISGQFSADIRYQTFGQKKTADLFAYDLKSNARETSFKVGQANPETIHLPVPGKYNVQNALISLLVAFELGVALSDAKKGLKNLTLTKNRLEWVGGKNGVDLLNDAYNASPTSMRAALDYFENIGIAGDKGVVLGDILELGEASKDFHEGLSEAIDVDSYKFIYLYGEEMRHLYAKIVSDGVSNKVKHFSGEKDALIKAIEKNAKAKDAILFKSSNGTDLIAVVDALKDEEN
jgi:UDP-N-acetylmuramoyl-tripeptide--D-alanyl-D-alanine ligase